MRTRRHELRMATAHLHDDLDTLIDREAAAAGAERVFRVALEAAENVDVA